MRNKSQFGSPAHPTIKVRGFIFAVFKGKIIYFLVSMANKNYKRFPVEVHRFSDSSFLLSNHLVGDFNIHMITRSIS